MTFFAGYCAASNTSYRIALVSPVRNPEKIYLKIEDNPKYLLLTSPCFTVESLSMFVPVFLFLVAYLEMALKVFNPYSENMP